MRTCDSPGIAVAVGAPNPVVAAAANIAIDLTRSPGSTLKSNEEL